MEHFALEVPAQSLKWSFIFANELAIYRAVATLMWGRCFDRSEVLCSLLCCIRDE